MTKKNPKKQIPNQIHSSIALSHYSAEPHLRRDHSLVEGGENFNEESANANFKRNYKSSFMEPIVNTNFKRNSKSSVQEPN